MSTAALEGASAPLAQRFAALRDYKGCVHLTEGPAEAPEGVLLALRRPTGSLFRIVGFQVSSGPRRDEIAQALAERLLDIARREEIFLLRAAAADAALLDSDLLPLLGFSSLAVPYAEAWLGNSIATPRQHMPLYRQSTRFTCGPASLLMSFGALGSPMSERGEEIALWREASSIAGLTGPGGCDPFGLALAAQARGFAPRILTSTSRAMLTERVDTDEKRELIEFVQSDFRQRVEEAGIPVQQRDFTVQELAAPVEAGGVALLLIDQFMTHGRHTPHWIVLHHHQDDWFLVNDPWTEPGRQEGPADAEHLPIRAATLDQMSWFGEPAYQAALILPARQT
jgi:hypothetical protein